MQLHPDELLDKKTYELLIYITFYIYMHLHPDELLNTKLYELFKFDYTLNMFCRNIYQALWISYLINYFISCTKKEIFVLCRF